MKVYNVVIEVTRGLVSDSVFAVSEEKALEAIINRHNIYDYYSSVVTAI